MDILNYIFIGITILWITSEIIINSVKRSTDASKDQASFWVIIVTTYLCPFLGVFIAYNFNIGAIFQGDLYHKYIGILFIFGGLIIRWAAILKLNKQFTVTVSIVEKHQVIDTGIYSYLRHPAYVGSLLSFIGLCLYLGNWISFIIIFFPVLLAMLNRIKIEENVLIEHFGNYYLDYAAKTKRLIPWIY